MAAKRLRNEEAERWQISSGRKFTGWLFPSGSQKILRKKILRSIISDLLKKRRKPQSFWSPELTHGTGMRSLPWKLIRSRWSGRFCIPTDRGFTGCRDRNAPEERGDRMGISWGVLHLAALFGSAVFGRDGSASRKAKDLSRVLHFSLRSIIRPSCRALQKHCALPFRRKCHVLRSCHFSGMTPLRVPAKQDHYHPSRQRPRKGQQGGSGDRQVSQSGKPLLRRSLRSLNLPAGRCPLGSPGRVFHPCIRNTQKCSTSGERSTGPSVMCLAISVRGLPALCTPRQERRPCIPPKGLHPFGIP